MTLGRAARKARQVVEFSDLDAVPEGVELCRDNRCAQEGLHAKHVVSRRGRPAKHCPDCLRLLDPGQRPEQCNCHKTPTET
ncbi:MAG TPA: hypothetical protein VF183_02185 [Acidimicrobiales bacterium]